MTPLYAGIGGVVRELTEMHTGINGVVTPITEMWAGVNGVNRQIFNTIKMATWQKWDVKTMYKYLTRTKTNDASVFSTGSKYLLYSENLPSITTQEFSSRPTNLKQLYPELTTIDIPITDAVPNSGYYSIFSRTSSLSLCNIFYMDKGERLTENKKNYFYFSTPRTTYYPYEQKRYYKGSNLLETVVAPEGTYPDNGKSGDYWYVKI